MAASRRKRRAAPRRSTKDRVLNARIPEQLDEELRNQAGRLGLSVSTIVRNALLNTFDLVDNIVSDSARIARNLGYPVAPADGAAARTAEPDASSAPVLAWQSGILNVNGVCEHCNALLPKGSAAGIAIPAGDRPAFLCANCLEQLQSRAAEPPPADDRQ